MSFGFQPIHTAFEANNAGVTLVHASTCEHGHPAFGITFPGRWIGQNTGPQLIAPVAVLLSRCTATHMVGAFAAYTAAIDGPHAGQAFMDDARTAFREMYPTIRELHTDGRICCEAAYRTGGREHTCHTQAQGRP